MRYADVAVEISPPDGAYQIVTSSAGARTPRGVGVGSEVEDIKAQYPGARCEDASDEGGAYCVVGHEARSLQPAPRGEARVLEGKPVSARVLYFGLASSGANAGRVGSIALNATSPRGFVRRR